MLTHVYDNNEITGRIYLQIQVLFPDAILSFTKGDKDFFYEYAFAVMHKLHATKYHLENYRRIEEAEYKAALQNSENENRECLELIFELEAFFFQIKSSLDMLVKLLDAVLGKGNVKTRTYGEAGNKLLPGLTRYKERSGANLQAIDNLISLIEANRDSWLKEAIDWRDELNHTKGLQQYMFTRKRTSKGEIVVEKPRFKNHDALDLMQKIYHNNLEYHQDFLAHAIILKLPLLFSLVPASRKDAVKEFGDISRYIKWALGVNP